MMGKKLRRNGRAGLSRAVLLTVVFILLMPSGALYSEEEALKSGKATRPLIDFKRYPDLVDASKYVPGMRVDLKYATKDNFMKQNVYGDMKQCYLVKDAAQKLSEAAKLLSASHPDLVLLAYDCVRPVRVQKKMWQVVKYTPARKYVANPNKKAGSMHNYGCAIDLTLARKKSGTPLDMGTVFDHFGRAAQPRREVKLLKSGQLKAEQVANRLLLREVMVRAGFLPINSEWWHFNCAHPKVIRKRYKKIK